jgi:hypothetical protein
MVSDHLSFHSPPQWLRLIVENRPENDQVEKINEINDIGNGVFSSFAINKAFDARRLAILMV